MKKSVLIVSLIFVIVVLSIILIFFLFFSNKAPTEKECTIDSDCVPASCCHASSCTSKLNAPNCSRIMCTMMCEANTLDCGQGECKCIKNKCSAVFK